MAIYYARANGNVNGTIWATTPSGTASNLFSSFTNQDTLMSNGFTVTLNVNTTVLEIRNDTTGGATAGGGFTLNNSITLTANVVAGGAIILTFSGISPNIATIIGNISGGTAYASVIHSGTGTLNITGSVSSGSGSSSSPVYNGANGTINIVGNINGPNINSANCVSNNFGGIINITGNVGNSTGANASTVVNVSNGTINIIGTVSGGNIAATSFGVANISIGTVNIIGTCIGGAVGAGATNTSTGTLIATRAKGNGFGPGSVGLSTTVGVNSSQNGTTRVYEIEYGTLGQSPTSGPIELVGANSNVAVFAVRLSTPKTLVDLNNATNLVPSSGNVRSGVSYNYGNNTGSCIIPNPNSVVYGVPVDNTIGSGLLSPVAVWNALTSSIGTSGSIGERLKNCSTVATVGKQLEGVL